MTSFNLKKERAFAPSFFMLNGFFEYLFPKLTLSNSKQCTIK
jgi:hypothetical protein